MHVGLGYIPIELLSYIFENLSLTELHSLEQACFRNHLRYTVNEYFRRRVVNSSSNPLFELVQIGQVQAIQHLASQSAVDVNIQDDVGQTPLHMAATSGLAAVVRALLQFPLISVDHRDCCERCALLLAAQNGHNAVVELLLKHGAEVDASTRHGETALTWAARNGHKKVIDLLIARNVDLSIADTGGRRGLDWAIMEGHDEVVELLLLHHNHFEWSMTEQSKVLLLAAESGNNLAIRIMLTSGADVNCKDDQGSTPLHLAASFGHFSAAELLLRWGADVNSRDKYGNSPLHWAIDYPTIMKLLLSKGAQANARNGSGKTSLMWSVSAEQNETTRMLLSLGQADVNIQDENGCTALHGAAAKGNKSIAAYLLDQGADATNKNVDGWLPLDVAAIYGHATTMTVLKNEMDIDSVTTSVASKDRHNEDMRCILMEMAHRTFTGSEGVSGLRLAVNSKNTRRLAEMLDAGVDVNELDPVGGATALTLASWFNDEEAVEYLLQHGATIDAKDSSGRTALHVAVESGYCDLVALLTQRGANVEVKVCGWTPLLLAAKRLWDNDVGPWMVQFLAMKAVDTCLDARDYYGRGVLHWCAVFGDKRTMSSLIQLDPVLLHARDHCGQSALQMAIGAYRPDLVRVLAQRGASLNDRTSDGLTLAHIAAYTGQLNILTLLTSAAENFHSCHDTDPGHASRSNVARLELGAKDADGYTALTIALLTGNLQVAQYLRRLPEGNDGDLEYRRGIGYAEIIKWRPPPLQLPCENETIGLQQVMKSNIPRKALFGTEVRGWLQDQHALVASKIVRSTEPQAS